MATSLKGATSITDFKMENILENFAFTQNSYEEIKSKIIAYSSHLTSTRWVTYKADMANQRKQYPHKDITKRCDMTLTFDLET